MAVGGASSQMTLMYRWAPYVPEQGSNQGQLPKLQIIGRRNNVPNKPDRTVLPSTIVLNGVGFNLIRNPLDAVCDFL